MNGRYDAIVVGAGHNGLISAAYLAKSGKRVLVLERRDIVGGATVTEEFWPGYHISTCSYVCSLLLPDVIRDLDLVRHGYDVRPLDPQYFVPFPDGSHISSWLDSERTKEEIRRFSPKDADNYDLYWEMWDRIISRMRPLLDGPYPSESELEAAFSGPDGDEDWRRLTEASVADLLDEFFESERTKAPLAPGGIIGTNAGPRDPGTAYVKFHHILGNVGGHQGAWGYVRGGMGAVSGSIASSARSLGVDILTDAEVADIEVEEGRAVGVTLSDGRHFEADTVLSNADHHRTAGMLGEEDLPEGVSASLASRNDRGSVVKVLMALDGVPEFTSVPGKGIGPQHLGAMVVAPTIDYLQRAWEDCAAGRPSEKPFMEAYMQSATEDGLAPPGKHTMSIFCQYAPYEFAEGSWETRRDEIGKNIVATFAEYAPNLPDIIEDMEVLGPPDIEARIGITGGNIFHGEITPDRTFSGRPSPEMSGYETPVAGLYLCGAGTWPGGSVFGAPGRNCAKKILAGR